VPERGPGTLPDAAARSFPHRSLGEPRRALAIGFSRPYIVAPSGWLVRPGFALVTWDDLNKPDVCIASDIGSLHETRARRFAPNAQFTGYMPPISPVSNPMPDLVAVTMPGGGRSWLSH
jgi:hypothetical protein